MSFKLDVSDEYTWPVKAEFPRNGGGFKSISFKARYKQLPSETIKRMVDGDMSDDEFFDMAFLGWEGLRDSSGEAVEENDENRRQLLEMVPMRSAVIRGFFESISGTRGKRGN